MTGFLTKENFQELEEFLVDDRKVALQPFKELCLFAEMVCTLFMVEGLEGQVQSVKHFVTYTGQNIFSKAVKGMISDSASVPSTLSELEKTSYAMLRDAVNDTLRTAASASLLRPKLQTMQNLLDVETPSLDHVLEAASLLPNLREGLRKGEAKPFEKSLLTTVVNFVDSLESSVSDSAPLGVSSETLEVLGSALKTLGKHDAALEAQAKLVKFATDFNKSIAQADLKSLCQKFNEAHEQAPQGEDVHAMAPEVSQALKVLLAKCGASIPADVKVVCLTSLKYGIKEVMAEAGCGVFGGH